MKKLLLFCVCIASLILCLSGCADDAPKQAEPIYVTVNGKVFEAVDYGDGIISTPEPLRVARIFHLTGDVNPLDLGELREYTLRSTENSDKYAAVYSYYIWDKPSPNESELQMRALLEGWGLSSENRLTAQWVTDNMDLAAEMLDIFEQPDWQTVMLIVNNDIDGCYERYVLGRTGEVSAFSG